MRVLILLGAAALAVALTPAAAPAESPGPQSADGFHHRPGDGRDHRDRHRHGGDSGFFVEYDAGAWALYNNRGWDPDSFNDWWHDRPDRAYPRWVQDQRRSGTCDQSRMWWSGSGWHC